MLAASRSAVLVCKHLASVFALMSSIALAGGSWARMCTKMSRGRAGGFRMLLKDTVLSDYDGGECNKYFVQREVTSPHKSQPGPGEMASWMTSEHR